MTKYYKLEVRLQSDSIGLLETVRKELLEMWPLAVEGQIIQIREGPNAGEFRTYLSLKKEAAVVSKEEMKVE